MYFSTFVLIMIVTVGVIAFGATIVAKLLNKASILAYRTLIKTRPVRVVSPLVTNSSSLAALKATRKFLEQNPQGNAVLYGHGVCESFTVRNMPEA